MATLQTIYVTHKTRNEASAETDANFQLQIERPGGDVLLPFVGQPHDERERGRTDLYRFNVSGRGVDSSHHVIMRMTDTDDGWHPESIFVIGVTTAGASVLLGSHPNWGPWFDRGASPAGPDTHRIA